MPTTRAAVRLLRYRVFVGTTSLVAAFSLGLACAGSGRDVQAAPGDPAQDAGETISVGAENTVKVQRERIESGPRLSGSLEAREQARLRAEVSGVVHEVTVELGEKVKRGQLLARIEGASIRNAFESARLAVRAAELDAENAERQRERTAKLVQAGALASSALESAAGASSAAAARLAQARAQLTVARDQLEATTIEAPIDGLVGERSINVGDVVVVGAPLFTIIDPSSMRLVASAPSDELAALRPGTPVDFVVRGYPERVFEGTIERVAPTADPVTRQITTLVAIPNPGSELLAGLFAEGRVAAEQRDTLVVPTSAIDRSRQEAAVVRIREGRAERVPVTLGLRDPQRERVEIAGDVAAGDLVLIGSALSVDPGALVTVRQRGSGT